MSVVSHSELQSQIAAFDQAVRHRADELFRRREVVQGRAMP